MPDLVSPYLRSLDTHPHLQLINLVHQEDALLSQLELSLSPLFQYTFLQLVSLPMNLL